MKVLFVSNEVAPYAKVGGLADVAGSLPQALAQRRIDVRIVMPLHRQCRQHGQFALALESLKVNFGGRTVNTTVLEATLPHSQVPVYFIKHDPYFDRPEVYGEKGSDYPDASERYAFFCAAALALRPALGFEADVIHANDWPTGLLPLFVRDLPSPPATLYTIHNLGYQGQFPPDEAEDAGLTAEPGGETLEAGNDQRQTAPASSIQHPASAVRRSAPEALADATHDGSLNFMAAGIRAATTINTVSERYAQEIQTPEFSHGLERLLQARSQDLFGVLNGIDCDLWSPATDGALLANFSARDLSGKARCKAALQEEMGLPIEPQVPLLGCVTRLAWQKGLDLLAKAIPEAIKFPMQVVVLGTGEADLEQVYADLDAERKRSAGKGAVAAAIRFDEALARRIYAGSDLFAMPSRYEPCGLGQMIAMAYGAIPVVHHTGGLADTVVERGPQQTGFVFDRLTAAELLAALKRAADAHRNPAAWNAIIANAMAQDFSWTNSAGRYEQLYETALALAHAQVRKVG